MIDWELQKIGLESAGNCRESKHRNGSCREENFFYYCRTNDPSLLRAISAEVCIYTFAVRGTAASYPNEACIIPCPSQEARYFHTGTYNGTCVFYPAFLFPQSLVFLAGVILGLNLKG